MKKLFLTFICFIICLPIFSPTINANDIKVTVNEEQVYFDVSPQIINDRTMVPMRAIFESLGASVEWDAENSQIYAYTEGMLINLSPNKIYMTITNGEHLNIKYLDSPPLIVNDRTLVPVRVISETMNCNVSWDSNNRVVSIKRANKTPESDKNKYYSNISIKVPTYTYVTGIPLSDIDTENGILYVYNNYNQDAISVYLSSLTECYGFTENEISSEDGFVFFLFSNKHIEVCVGVSELHQIVGIIVSENINSNKVNIDESLKNENKIDNNKVNEVRSSINNINNEINKIKSDIRQYEQRISDINDEIKNLRKTLNNVSQERNVRVFQNGTWVWVPDENKTQLIKDEINELQLELDLYKDLLDEAEETLSKLEDEKDGLEKELRSN